MEEYIGKVALKLDHYSGTDHYTDGAIEDELLRIVSERPEGEWERIACERAQWPLLYHLSKVRENCIEWIELDRERDTVLEIGAGCGALTGALAQKAKRVTCVELSKKRSTINAVRNREKENIEIRVGNFEQVEKGLGRYRLVTLIGVLEYAAAYLRAENPHRKLLQIAKEHLLPGGRLVLAIENKLGLKYWAGCREDHAGRYFESIEGYPGGGQVCTFSLPELKDLFTTSGYKDIKFYYPYPDYKLPLAVYSDARLPAVGELYRNLRNFDGERAVLFDEGKAFDNLIRSGLFPLFSNSFIVVAG